MEETNLQHKKIARLAAKWWANVLDGRAKQDLGFPKGEELAQITQEDPTLHAQVVMLQKLLESHTREQAVPRYKRDAFEVKLAELIEKDLNETGCAYLYVEEGEVEGRLGLAAYYCGIEHGAHSAFPCNTEMFVLPDKIELKYGKSALMQVVYSEKDTKSSILLKEFEGRGGR